MPAKRTENPNILQLKVILEGEMVDRFLALKTRYGFESNTDLLRMIITKAYEELKGIGY